MKKKKKKKKRKPKEQEKNFKKTPKKTPEKNPNLRQSFCMMYFFISIWKFGIRLGYVYYKNKLRLNLCLLYAYTNQNLKYNFKDSYSGKLLYLNTMFSFSFSSVKTLFLVHSRNTSLQQEKHCFKNDFTILQIAVFSKNYRPLISNLIELH